MKKILFLIISLFIFISISYATDIERVELKWTDTNNDRIREIDKIKGSYYVFTDHEIIKYYPSSKKQTKIFKTTEKYEAAIQDDNTFLVFVPSDRENSMYIKVLDLDLKEKLNKKVPMEEVIHIEPSNDNWLVFGSLYDGSHYHLVYLLLDKDFNILEHQEVTNLSGIYYTGKKNNIHYFGQNGTNESYKFVDGEFVRIDKSDFPSGRDFSFYLRQIANNEYEEPKGDKGVTEAERIRISRLFQKKNPNNGESLVIRKDNDNYAVSFTEYSIDEDAKKITYHQRILAYLDSNYNQKWHIEFPQNTYNYAWKNGNVTSGITISKSMPISAYNGNILLATNDTDKQVFNIYDYRKNNVADLAPFITSDITYKPIFTDFTETGVIAIYSQRKFEFQEPTGNFLPGNNRPQYRATFLDNTSKNIIYYFDIYYKIYTKVNGKGKVTVNRASADASDKVEFIIEPEEGYVLGMVKVTDANGNVIYFTDYTFTMPSADVTIEVTFVKKEELNPNTKDIAITALVIIFILSTGLMIYNKRRLVNIK